MVLHLQLSSLRWEDLVIAGYDPLIKREVRFNEFPYFSAFNILIYLDESAYYAHYVIIMKNEMCYISSEKKVMGYFTFK